MATYDFDRFKDNQNTYLCKDTEGRRQLEETKTELNKMFQDFKDSLQDRYVLIGDSYLEGYTPDGNVTSFGSKLQKMLKKDNQDFIMSYKGGTGFINSVGNETFLTLTQKAYDKTSHPETISHVIYAGGYNDQGYNSEDIQSAIQNCYSKVKTLFPNATMYVANIACNFKNAQILFNLHDKVEHAFTYSAIKNDSIVNLGYIGNCLHERAMMASDGYHPKDWGQGILACALYYKLKGGEWFPVGRYSTFTAKYSSPSISVSTTTGYESFTKDTVSIVVSRISFSTQPTIPTEREWVVGNISDTQYLRTTYTTFSSIQTTGIVSYNGGANFRTVSMELGINDSGNFFVRLHTLNKDDTNYENLPNIKFIAFDNAIIRVPISYI